MVDATSDDCIPFLDQGDFVISFGIKKIKIELLFYIFIFYLLYFIFLCSKSSIHYNFIKMKKKIPIPNNNNSNKIITIIYRLRIGRLFVPSSRNETFKRKCAFSNLCFCIFHFNCSFVFQ
jgi:hypothetical protein